jgi:phage tail sheath protein FI
MPFQKKTPGVYIQENSAGNHLIAGASTSVAMFLGRAKRGPLQKPVKCLNFAKFDKTFSSDYAHGDLARALSLFFQNGGTQCYVLRLARQSSAIARLDDAPLLSDYQKAFALIDQKADLFNLLVLPQDADLDPDVIASLWAPASVLCQKHRAILVMDPPRAWNSVQAALNPAQDISQLCPGLVLENCALFYPQIKISENGTEVLVGGSGALAGLIARTDGLRGVWKAPAGPEATILGITGLEQNLSEAESGLLSAWGINPLRIISGKVINWGARTLAGNGATASEDKYLPVRRLELFLEQSLYTGLQWTVFELNDEALWARIRMSAGAFLQNLFRQGAFQGQKPEDAYFVKCDFSTTTQNDLSLGRVNVLVGFAPLKPAEFVVLRLQLTAQSK